MDYFDYHNGVLRCERVDLGKIADAVGTPCYVYSRRTLERHAESIDGAWSRFDHLTCYSVKANSNRAVLSLLAKRGLGADIVSGGELHRALVAGFPANKIVFSGVGKSADELRYALREGILAFNVESEAELAALNRIAEAESRPAPVSLRINPDVDPATHPKVATGLATAKFGIPHERAIDAYKAARDMEWIEVVGIDAHIGSGLNSVAPFVEAAKRLLALIELIRDEGIDIGMIDIGGGLGITYDDEEPPSPAEWSSAVGAVLAGAGLKIISEPGRSLVGNAGVLLAKVLYVKRNSEKPFVVTDTGMNDLARPSMYDSFHRIEPVVSREGERESIVADIVGPICETGDVLGRARSMPVPDEGDILAVMSAGAYGFTMSSNYNSRPRPAEVLVDGDRWQVVRERETYGDLVHGEKPFVV
jgi:diaminopimelate decarboxylase